MDGLIEGRIVHYVTDADLHRPAIVVEVGNQETGLVYLHVFFKEVEVVSGFRGDIICKYDEYKRRDSWHWIEGSKP